MYEPPCIRPSGERESCRKRCCSVSALAIRKKIDERDTWRHRQRERGRLNGWFAILRTSVATDQEERGLLPNLTAAKILTWAIAYHARTGQWSRPGPILESEGETWLAVEAALYLGMRGFPGYSTLARFLNEHLGVPISGRPPALSLTQILRWADAHFRRSGSWPIAESGLVADAPGENWNKIDAALRTGARGLPKGSSLARLLAEHRGVSNKADRPTLNRIAGSSRQDFCWRPTARRGNVSFCVPRFSTCSSFALH